MRFPSLPNTSFIIGILIGFCLSHVVAQKKYFEYNNPAAIRLSKKELNLVTGREWFLNRIEFVSRGDTLDFPGYGGHAFKADKTFAAFRTSGTWSVFKKKYIVCKPDTSGLRPNIPDIVLGVVSISDTSLVLQKLHSSSRDMFRTYYFHARNNISARQGIKGGPIEYISSNRRNSKFRDLQRLDTITNDSLSFQFKEPLTQEGFFVSDSGILEVETRDSTYQIRLRARAGKEGRRVFRADELVSLPDNIKRFTPGDSEVLFAETALTSCVLARIRETGVDLDFALHEQFRQLAGFINPKGDRMIQIAAFVSYYRDWKSVFVSPQTFNGALLVASINLKTGHCEELVIR